MSIGIMLVLVACGGNQDSTTDTEVRTEEEKAVEVTDAKYKELLAGGLNKQQFQFVLAHLPGTVETDGVTMEDLSRLLLYISEATYDDSPNVSIDGWVEDDSANLYYNLSEVNNMIKIVTDFQFSEENNGACPNAMVQGDKFLFSVASPAISYKAEIDSAVIDNEEMIVFYVVDIVSMEEGKWHEVRTATLSKNEDGLYQIKKIDTDEVVIPTWQEQYEEVIVGMQGQKGGYTLEDMDGDECPELIVSIEDPAFEGTHDWTIYTCDMERGLIKELPDSYTTVLRTAIYRNPFGPGFVDCTYTSWDGMTYYSEVKFVDGRLEDTILKEFQFDDLEKGEYHVNFTERVEWTEFTDLSLLNE